MNLKEQIKSTIRDVPDFPKPGILFKDITPLLQDPKAFDAVLNAFEERYCGRRVDCVAGIESRGFVFGAPLANRLKVPFIPIRKKGKLPYKSVQETYDLEYGTATIEMHVDAIRKGQQVLMIDDLLATGGTAAAACRLVEKQGGTIVECAFVVELAFLNGRQKLNGREVFSLVQY